MDKENKPRRPGKLKPAQRKAKAKALEHTKRKVERHITLLDAPYWPLHECLMTRDWDMEGPFVQILVARRSPDARYAVGIFLIDLCCTGIKKAGARLILSRVEYEKIRLAMSEEQVLVPTDLDLAAKIVIEAEEYARPLGFTPPPEYPDAVALFAGTRPDECPTRIPLGMNGKPCYITSPGDNVPAIIQQLEQRLGPGNFDVII